MATRMLPRAKGFPIVGTLPYLIAAGGASKLHEYVDKRHKELGPIFRDKIGPVSAIFVSSPDYMRRIFGAEGRSPRHIIPESWALYNEIYKQKRGLLFMDGEEWIKFRKQMNGVFLKPDNQIMISAISVVADKLVDKWKRGKYVPELERTLYNWSLDSILSLLLGAETYVKQEKELQDLVTTLSSDLHNIFVESAKLSLLPAQQAMRWNLPPWKRFVRTAKKTFATTTQLMSQLEASGVSSNGLLSQLLHAGIQGDDLSRVTTDLILAAGDTTAYTTQWLLYLLGKHNHVQKRLYEETKTLTDVEALENQYLKGCLRETLRLYPVAPFITRYLPKSLQLDGYQLQENDLIIMSLYSSGRNGASFPEPDNFQPERWIREGREYRGVLNSYASLPFAMGSRSCIGRKIAETQICLTIKKIINAATIEAKNKEKVDIVLKLITTPSTPIVIALHQRN